MSRSKDSFELMADEILNERVIEIGGDEKPDDALADLRHELQQERQARLRIEAQISGAQNQAQWDSARSRAYAEYGKLADKLKAAKESYDATAESNLALEMARAAQHIAELDRAYQQARQQPRQAEDFDTWLARQDEPNRRWIERNRNRFERDPDFQRKAVAASGHALAQGMKLGSAEYYDFIDNSVGISKPRESVVERRPEPFGGQTVARDTTPMSGRNAATRIAAAPPSRTVPGQERDGPRRFTLSSDEAAIARALFQQPGVSEVEAYRRYASHREGLMREGAMDKDGHAVGPTRGW